LFCFGVLVVVNCLGQPILMMLSHLKNWPISRVVSAVTAAFALNAILFGCLPTMYASWNSKKLPKD
jgi:hypothetical protein